MHKNIVWTLPMLLAAAFTIGGCGKTTLPAAPTALTAPDGNYVVMQYDTNFSNKKSAVETVTFMEEKDGKWKAAGYYIK